MKTIHVRAYSLLVEQLRAARIARKVSQQSLADTLGLPQSFISKYEQAERRLDVIELVRIADALGLDAGKLLSDIQLNLGEPRRRKTRNKSKH